MAENPEISALCQGDSNQIDLPAAGSLMVEIQAHYSLSWQHCLMKRTKSAERPHVRRQPHFGHWYLHHLDWTDFERKLTYEWASELAAIDNLRGN